MWTVASLLFAGVITAVDGRHPSTYNEHTDRPSFGHVQTDDRTDYIDRHNYGYALKRDKNVRVATSHAKLIFNLELRDWQVEF